VEIRYSKVARKALTRSNKGRLILDKIEQLASDPESLANNLTQLKGRIEWRMRVQDWRVIFVHGDDHLQILDVLPRGAAYEDL
jgi:mRNA interferase RelE/StbE